MTFSIAGKTAIVTGAAHGVGLAIARRFVTEGANVVFADRDEDTLRHEVDALWGDVEGQVRVAERLLVEGSPLKARRLLERLRKSNPEHTRSADLLWALDGDFALRGVMLADLARVHAMPTQSLADLPEDADRTIDAGETDETEPPAAFPTLFKNLEE